ncbi:MAG TPA: YvrJ family protein [Bacillota bacterium]|nr:YvrJ family protein [Bacillota bacterium]
MEEVVTMIGNWGFPIAVSVYLLVRIEGKLENLTDSIRRLSEAITRQEAS